MCQCAAVVMIALALFGCVAGDERPRPWPTADELSVPGAGTWAPVGALGAQDGRSVDAGAAIPPQLHSRPPVAISAPPADGGPSDSPVSPTPMPLSLISLSRPSDAGTTDLQASPDLCSWGEYRLPTGEQIPSEPLEVVPELIASGTFWSLALSDDRVFTIESLRIEARVPEQAEVLSFDLASLERHSLFSKMDGLEDPAALLVHGTQLYIHDWGTRSIFQVPLATPELTVLAAGFGGGLALSRSGGSVFLSDYRANRVVRVEDLSFTGAPPSDLQLDPTAVVVEELSQVPAPSGIAAWPGHAAWGTNGHNGHLHNQVVVRDLRDGGDLAIDVGGLVAAIDVSAQELIWATYGPGGSELSRMGLNDTGSPQGDQLDKLMLCGQPTASVLRGALAIYGGPGLILWERDSNAVQVLRAGFVRYLVANETHIYYVTWDGLYRIAY